jgi:hypothetical protein
VATVNLGNEGPIAILITPTWGLIVVKTISSIFVFDVNGFSVRKVTCEIEFLRWTAFHTRDGFERATLIDISKQTSNPIIPISSEKICTISNLKNSSASRWQTTEIVDPTIPIANPALKLQHPWTNPPKKSAYPA